MNPAIYLSCLVIIVGSLVWTASAAPAQEGNDFNSELARLKNIYRADSPDQFAKARNAPDLAKFYEKHSNQFQMTPEERLKADADLRQYKEEEAKQSLVEGAPAQGSIVGFGFDILWTQFLKSIVPFIPTQREFLSNALNVSKKYPNNYRDLLVLD